MNTIKELMKERGVISIAYFNHSKKINNIEGVNSKEFKNKLTGLTKKTGANFT